MKARILVADDHEVVRQGLREILGATEDMEVVGEAGDGVQAERLARTVPAELMILDIALPVRRGMQVLESLRAADVALKVLFFSMYPASQFADAARRAGAQGFVSKDADSATLLHLMRGVLAGGAAFAVGDGHGAGLAAADDPFAKLSARELEVMQGLLRGASLLQIAQEMNIGSKSVTTYRSRLLLKLGLSCNVELAALAARKGYF